MHTASALPIGLVALVLGAVFGWLLRAVLRPDDAAGGGALGDQLRDDLERARQASAVANEASEVARDRLAVANARVAQVEAEAAAAREQLVAVREDREQLVAQMKAISGDALKETSEEFARQRAEERAAELAAEQLRLAAAEAAEETRLAAALAAEEKRVAMAAAAEEKRIAALAAADAKRQAEAERARLEARAAEQELAAKEAEARAAKVEALIKPLGEQLVRFERKVEQLEGERKTTAGALAAQVEALKSGVGQLGEKTDGLATAFRKPQVRGAWGELHLKTAFEQAGLAEGLNFELQETIQGEERSMLRPDAIVRIGGGKTLAVDSKVPYAAYDEAIRATDPQVAQAQMVRHAEAVKTHVRQLSGKEYQAAMRSGGHATPDFVVLFIPSEAMYFAALDADPRLLEFALERKVLLAAPMSLMAILRAVHIGWQQEQIAQDAQEIEQIATELHKRFATFFEHFTGVGTALGRAVGKYNDAVGSFERSLVPKVRQLEDRQIKSSKDLPLAKVIEVEPRRHTRGLTIESTQVVQEA